MRSKTVCLWWAGAVATLALRLPGCTQTSSAQPPATPTATPPLALSPTPTMAVLPAPVPSLLAQLPADCPTRDPPQTLTLTQPISVSRGRGQPPPRAGTARRVGTPRPDGWRSGG